MVFSKLTTHFLATNLDALRETYMTADSEEMDVRLCARENGEWFLAWGDVSSDTEHTAFCASASIVHTCTRRDLRDIAHDLIEQICEQQADNA